MQLSKRPSFRIWLILSITLIVSFVVRLSFIHPSTANAAPSVRPAATYPPNGSHDVTYHNGPVIHNPDAKLIFEGTWQNSDMQRINNYFADASGSSFESILTQYYDTTGHISNTITVSGLAMDPNFLHSHWCGNSANSVIDTGLATNPAGEPNDVYDEIQAQISANHWNSSSIFFVYTPPGYDVLWQSCGNAPCGYHSEFTTTGGATNLIYAVIPYAGGPCGTTDGNAIDTAINVTSHEQFEAITNPTYTILQQSGGGWYNSDCGSPCEIGDKCGGTWPGITLNGHSYPGVQFEYSNLGHTCTDSLPQPPPPPTPTVTPPTPTPVPHACYNQPSKQNCDGQDYIQQGCPDFPQQSATDPNQYVFVQLQYAGNVHCQTNWTWAKITNNAPYVLARVSIATADGRQLVDFPRTSSWYTNMLWAPTVKAQACVEIQNITNHGLVETVCTPWQ